MDSEAQARDLKTFIIKMIVAIALVALTWMLWHLRELLMLVFGAVLVSVILRLVADPIHRRLGLGQGLSLTIAVAILLGSFLVAMWLFGAEVARQTNAFADLLPQAWESLRARLETIGLGSRLDDWLDSASGSGVVSNISGVVMSIGGGLTDLVLVLFGGIYIAAQPELYRSGLLKLLPARSRPLADKAVEDSGRALRLWLKGRLISMTVVAILTGIGLTIIGVPAALTLAILAGLLEFIPFAGPIISAIPAILLALAQSPESAFWTALLFLLIQQLEGNVIEPLVQQRAVELPPALLLFAIVAATLLFGTVGILLGAPLLVVVYVLVKRLYVRETLNTDTPMPGERSKD